MMSPNDVVITHKTFQQKWARCVQLVSVGRKIGHKMLWDSNTRDPVLFQRPRALALGEKVKRPGPIVGGVGGRWTLDGLSHNDALCVLLHVGEKSRPSEAASTRRASEYMLCNNRSPPGKFGLHSQVSGLRSIFLDAMLESVRIATLTSSALIKVPFGWHKPLSPLQHLISHFVVDSRCTRNR